MENNNTINNIQKPVSLIMTEAKENIVNAINEVQLHPVVLEMIVKELYMEIKDQAKMMIERESAEYQRTLMEAMKANEVKEDPEVVSDVE